METPNIHLGFCRTAHDSLLLGLRQARSQRIMISAVRSFTSLSEVLTSRGLSDDSVVKLLFVAHSMALNRCEDNRVRHRSIDFYRFRISDHQNLVHILQDIVESFKECHSDPLSTILYSPRVFSLIVSIPTSVDTLRRSPTLITGSRSHCFLP